MPQIEVLEEEADAAFCKGDDAHSYNGILVKDDEGDALFYIRDYRYGAGVDASELREELILILGGSLIAPRKAA